MYVKIDAQRLRKGPHTEGSTQAYRHTCIPIVTLRFQSTGVKCRRASRTNIHTYGVHQQIQTPRNPHPRASFSLFHSQGPCPPLSHCPPVSPVHLSRAPPGVELHAVLGQADVAAVGAQDVQAHQQVDLPVLDHGERAPKVRVPNPDWFMFMIDFMGV